MKTVLVTGAFGNVGRSALAALDGMGMATRAFEYPSKANRVLARTLGRHADMVWGDVRDAGAVAAAVDGVDAVIHLAAVIPPAADADPARAAAVNIGGTANVLAAVEASPRRPRLVFSSSVATYGDRVRDWYIRVDDPLHPCDDDEYAKQKVECERLVRASATDWVICRLSYIVWRRKLAMDPLMFRMPPATRLEVCHTEDTGYALAKAAFCDEAVGGTYNLAGGESCRTDFRAYLDRMMSLFGLGDSRFLPDAAFSDRGYHCGYLDTAEAQRLFGFQRKTLEDYYAEVAEEAKGLRFWARLFAPAVKASILARSPYPRKLAERAVGVVKSVRPARGRRSALSST